MRESGCVPCLGEESPVLCPSLPFAKDHPGALLGRDCAGMCSQQWLELREAGLPPNCGWLRGGLFLPSVVRLQLQESLAGLCCKETDCESHGAN